jgi:hypothetical protein
MLAGMRPCKSHDVEAALCYLLPLPLVGNFRSENGFIGCIWWSWLVLAFWRSSYLGDMFILVQVWVLFVDLN